jgi:4-hydroxythreonine-4-phosphate dehydrogenase
MLLVGAAPWGSLRVALATTHLPLAAVPAAITREALTQTLRIAVADLERKFGIAKPRSAYAASIPTPVKAAIWAARKSTSSLRS